MLLVYFINSLDYILHCISFKSSNQCFTFTETFIFRLKLTLISSSTMNTWLLQPSSIRFLVPPGSVIITCTKYGAPSMSNGALAVPFEVTKWSTIRYFSINCLPRNHCRKNHAGFVWFFFISAMLAIFIT